MYTVIDLNELAAELGEHFNKREIDTYTGQCTNCWATVTQTMNECPDCKIPVVWLKSRVWEDEFGSAKARIAQLRMVTPTTSSGEYLCATARVQAFSKKSDDIAWAKAEHWFGEAAMRSVVDYVTKDKRGRAAMAHALATARKKLREEKPSKPKSEEDFAPTTKML